MTTLQLNHWPRTVRCAVPEWGTGKARGAVDLWTPRTPTWQMSGDPTKQNYGLTRLALSNVRLTDQLLPQPQNGDMGAIVSSKAFPAEHPFHTHTSRFALFPNFDSADDPQTGSRARQLSVRSARMPAQPAQFTVPEKISGCPIRHEVQLLLPESSKPALEWKPGDVHDQVSKLRQTAKQSVYPTPVKTYLPSVPVRDDARCTTGNMVVSERTANVLTNLERSHKMTNAEMSYTGLGSAFPVRLDNLYDKQRQREALGEVDTALRPQGWAVFDPARRLDGRKEMALVPQPPLPSAIHEHPEPEETWGRSLTASEREEHRLWFGKAYASLPDLPPGGHVINRPATVPARRHKPVDFWTEKELTLGDESERFPYADYELHNPHLDLQEALQRCQHDNRQQMEASNRFSLLDSQTPAHNMAALKRKCKLSASTGALPQVFYGHEGRFLSERAGLYGTSYDPYALRGAMQAQEHRGAIVMDTGRSHVGAMDLATSLNEAVPDAMRYNRTFGGLPGSVPQLYHRASLHETMTPFEKEKWLQTVHLQPDVMTADVRTQDGGLIQRETTYGSDFNTKNFLQERQLQQSLRKEPMAMMSHNNGRLSNVKPMTSQRCARLPQDGEYDEWKLPAEDRRLRPQPGESTDVPGCSELKPVEAECTSYPTDDISYTVNTVPPVGTYPSEKAIAEAMARSSATKQGEDTRTSLERSWCNRYAKQSTMPPCESYHLGSKTDPRFQWQPGQGQRQPQTPLLAMQDEFSKSSARDSLVKQFPESHPHLQDNMTTGKKHVFYDVNLQALR